MKYELWQDEDGCGLSFFPCDEGYARQLALLEPAAKLIWTVEAGSWNEAMARYYEYMGWGLYRPMD